MTTRQSKTEVITPNVLGIAASHVQDCGAYVSEYVFGWYFENTQRA